MTVDFDLTLFLKETQLQHGLRAEDYARYHRYTTNRLASLRQQLNLSNDKKKFLHKDVTPQNATDVRHLMLLALYAERCWAEAEVLQTQQHSRKELRSGAANAPKGGVAPPDQYRKRLNKSLKWAAKLQEVANTVASARVQTECMAYLKDTAGRCYASHGKFKEAKAAFLEARETYATLQSTSAETQWLVIVAKMNELDDRVTYCMQRLGEDPACYRPPPIFSAGGADGTAEDAVLISGAAQLAWNGHTLHVYSIKVRDALREAQQVEVEPTEARLRGAHGVIPVGQSNRLLDLMDRRINYYNDALAHARQDLRAAQEGPSRTEYQLIVHYIIFQVARETLRRTLFLAEIYGRRFEATERTLKMLHAGSPSASSSDAPRQRCQQQRKKKSEVAPTQYASPLEVARLYRAAAESVGEMELLPGVAGRPDVDALSAVCAAGQLFFTGESWRLSEQWSTSMKYYRDALALLLGETGSYASSLRERIEQRLLQGSAEVVLTSSPTMANIFRREVASPVRYLSETDDQTTQVAHEVMRFPPNFQAAPCKPVFVDIASTFVDYPAQDEDSQRQNAGATVVSRKESNTSAAQAKGEKKSKGWLFGWGSS